MSYILVSLGVALFCWCVYFWAVHPRPMVAVGLMLTVLQANFGNANGLDLAGVQLYPGDLLWGSALVACGIDLIRRRSRSETGKAWLWAFLALTAASLTVGIVANGAQLAGNDARTFLYFTAGALAMSLIPRGQLPRFAHAWLATSLALVAVSVTGWLTYGFGGSTSEVHVIQENAFFAGGVRDARPIHAIPATIITQAFVLVAFARVSLGRMRHTLAFTAVLGLTVLLLQHRTLWVALLVALLVATITGRAAAVRGRALKLFAGAICVVAVTLVAFPIAGNMLGGSAADAFGTDSTFAWRRQSWVSLVTGRSAFDWMVGSSFGSGYERAVTVGGLSGFTDVNPHNFYVQTVLRLGIIGLVVLVAAIVRPAIRALRSADRLQFSFGLCLVILACLCLSYPAGPAQGLLLGAVVFMTQHSPRSQEGRGTTDESGRLRNEFQQVP